MGSPANSAFGPPPIPTPITSTQSDQLGIPYQDRSEAVVPAGNLAIGWAAWFNALFASVLLATAKIAGILQVVDQTLTTASTTINIPTNAYALFLTVILRQDATGGRAVVWGAGFSGYSSAIDTTASTISVFLFSYSSSVAKWVMCGQPTTGMTP